MRKRQNTDATTDKRLRAKAGVLLDISLGGTPQSQAVTLQELDADPLNPPWPLPDGAVHTAVVTHVLEYLSPERWFAWWNELHRIVRVGGLVYVSGPYGGDESWGWLSDPTHKTRVVEQSFAWLDPRLPLWEEHARVGRSLPRPWHPLQITRVPGTHGTVSYNAVLTSAPVGGGMNGGR